MLKPKLLSFFCFLLFFSVLNGQTSSKQIQAEVSKTYAVKLGKTAPISTLVPMKSADLEKKSAYKKRYKGRTIPNFLGRDIKANAWKDALPQGYDPVHQGIVKSAGSTEVIPNVNINGMQTGAAGNPSPPDPDGAIGKDHYVQMVNATAFQVFDKTGEAVSGIISMNTIWAGMGVTSLGDPIVFFDQEYERWFLTEFNGSGNALLIAVSETSDPLGSYYTYEFSTPSFPDYPKYSIWSNAVVVTTNEGGGGQECYLIDRLALINGENNVSIQRFVIPNNPGSPGFFVTTPVDWIGDTAPPADALPMVMRMNDDAWSGAGSEDKIEIFEIDVDWDDSDNSVVTQVDVLTAPFDSNPCSVPGFGFSCIPQLNGGGIDGLQEIIMNQVKYRNFGSYETMVLCFVVDYTGGDDISGIRWIEMRRSGGEDWSVYQEGTFAPEDGRDRFMPSIAIDKNGNIGLAYSVSSDDIYPGLAFTGRKSSDPLGEMTVQEYTIVEGQGAAPNSRYGDYSCLTVDPVSGNEFWFTAEYIKFQSGGWGTMITSFELGRDTFDISPISLDTPVSSNTLGAAEAVSVTVRNNGIETVNDFGISCYLDGVLVADESVSTTLATDETYAHTFIPTVDLSQTGLYEFEIITNWSEDQATSNDTLRVNVVHEYDFDAAITAVDSDEFILCSNAVEISAVLMNAGFELLESADITVYANDVQIGNVINWTGSLAFGASESVSILVEGLTNGALDLSVEVTNPNGQADENPSNDSSSRLFDVNGDGVNVQLVLTTDGYPDETTWVVFNENGDTLYTGGPYIDGESEYIETFCLPDEECFTFRINDSYGDGLNGGFFYDDGYYEIKDSEGNVLASLLDVNFGDFEENEFCTGTPCVLTAEADIEPESSEGAADGFINVTVFNGSGPFEYSIDNGGSFQSSSLFENLSAGVYEIQVVDVNGCGYSFTAEVLSCALMVELVVTDESENGLLDGSIEVNVSGANGALEYSINGGFLYQDSNVFDELGNGEYSIWVRDEAGCITIVNVTVNAIINSVRKVYNDIFVEVSPNPGNGLYDIKVSGVQHDGLYLPIQILDASGKIVHNWNLVWYDDMYRSQVSIYEEPAGMYFVRFKRSDIPVLVKMIKQ
jgi:hypothetical protein